MSKIKIKNFGPIKEGCIENDGWMDVKKVTMFIGSQGSGKSTLAKLISTLTWLEKAINRGDQSGVRHADFYNFFKYQRIDNYFRDNTEIEYIGDKIKVQYEKNLKFPSIEVLDTDTFKVPKIMYVPAERNFLSSVRNAFGLRNLPYTLNTFAEELRKGQIELKDKLLDLPIGVLKYRYDSKKDNSYILGEDYELDLVESSSGYQSLVPLYLVSKFLTDQLQKGKNVLREQLNAEQSVRRNKEISDIMFDQNLSPHEKDIKVKAIDAKYLNTCFINIVEEPEQNLFPNSQQEILHSLLAFNNMNPDNKLIMTTHSPYLLVYLTLCVEAHGLKQKANTEELKSKLNEIVPLASTIDGNDLVVYQLDEKNGTIEKLKDYKGLPSDENKLNDGLIAANDDFSKLLDLEDLCR